jgi:hypothetical protein
MAGQNITRLTHVGEHSANGDWDTNVYKDFSKYPIDWRFNIHVDFVGRHRKDYFIFPDWVTRFFEPGRHCSFGHCET